MQLLQRLSRSFGRRNRRGASPSVHLPARKSKPSKSCQFRTETQLQVQTHVECSSKMANEPEVIENRPDNIDIPVPSAPNFEEKMVKHMSRSAHELLSNRLRPVSANDWRTLADKLGFSYEDILTLSAEVDPVETLIRKWEFSNSSATIAKLKTCLLEMERLDILEDLAEFEESTPFPSEYRMRQQGQQVEIPNPTRLPHDQMYEAFICYAQPDIEFAREVLRRMEDEPYRMRLCIDFRDIIPGGFQEENYAIAIERRCRKIIVILSSNFTEDENAEFQARIGLHLSPGLKKRILIPIKYDECDIPLVFRFITHIDNSREDTREFFWFNLARALGYTPPR